MTIPSREEMKRAIRERYRAGWTVEELAAVHGVSVRHIEYVVIC